MHKHKHQNLCAAANGLQNARGPAQVGLLLNVAPGVHQVLKRDVVSIARVRVAIVVLNRVQLCSPRDGQCGSPELYLFLIPPPL